MTVTLAVSTLIFPLIVACMIAFGGRKAPPPFPGLEGVFASLSQAKYPDLQSCSAREGTTLTFRAYPAHDSAFVTLLIHGSASDSRAMHTIGEALQRRGVAAYAMDVRGHGGSGRRGDVDYVGQLEDDVADMLAHIRSLHSGAAVSVVGHSMGGGLALRYAGSSYGETVDRYVVASPLIHHAVSTTRRDVGGWAVPFLPRIIGLSILDSMHIRIFQYLPVIAFAVPASIPDLTSRYSFRLQSNFRPHMNWKSDIRNIRRPVTVLVGTADELFVSSAYAPLLEPLNPHIVVRVLPGIGHFGVYVEPVALNAIAEAILG